MASYTSILSAGDDWSRIVLFDNHSWPEYARRYRLDRGRPASDGAGGDLRPPCRFARGARDADGDHPLLHQDQQAEAWPAARLGRDDDAGARRPAATSFFHGAWAAWYLRFMVRERASALARGGRQAVDERSRGARRAPRSRRAPGRRVCRHGNLDSAPRSAERNDLEPNRLATGVRHVRQRRAGARRRRAHGQPGR